MSQKREKAKVLHLHTHENVFLKSDIAVIEFEII